MANALDNPWKFLLTSMSGLIIYGELTNAIERTVTEPLMGTPSLSCTIRLDHPLANTVLNEECLIKAYRGSILLFHGPVITSEEVGSDNARTIRITAAGAWWRASKRLLRGSLTEDGYSDVANSTENLMKQIMGHANGAGTAVPEYFTGIGA